MVAQGFPLAGWTFAVLAGTASAQGDLLEYVSRYHCQGVVDHVMGVEPVLDHHALVASNVALTLVDLDALTVDGTRQFLHRLQGYDVTSTTTRADGVCFVNLRQGGFGVVEIDPLRMRLSWITEVAEPGVFYDRMALAGNLLYVAAHSYGLRIFDVSVHSKPKFVGALRQGLDDACAVAVAGDVAWVADGAGGLKQVDVSDPTAPFVVWGETTDGAPGTALDVLVAGERVIVASGAAGVVVHDASDPATRSVWDTRICAKQLALAGDLLAVADTGGLALFRIAPDGTLLSSGSERGQRRSLGGEATSLRIWSGVAFQRADRLLSATWDTMDVYDVVDAASGGQPDLTASAQRIRFAPAGGTVTVQLQNQGGAPLTIGDVRSSEASVTASPKSGVIAPGATLDLTIAYDGGPDGDAVVLVFSDDPDEDPLPIQVLGDTPTLDPGERAPPFALDQWTFDHATRTFAKADFDLDAHTGEVVVLSTFGTW